jgi:hypothetical protein
MSMIRVITFCEPSQVGRIVRDILLVPVGWYSQTLPTATHGGTLLDATDYNKLIPFIQKMLHTIQWITLLSSLL